MASLQASKTSFLLTTITQALSLAPTGCATFTKNHSNYKFTVVKDYMTYQVKPCIDFKPSPLLVNLNAGFFSAAHTSNMDFYLLELSQSLHGYSIAELDLPIELFFISSKIVTFFWLEATGSFAFISNSISCGLSTS